MVESESLPGINSATEKILRILDTLREELRRHHQTLCQFPFLTASFAQSIDGKIAMFTGEDSNATTSNLPLSGDESLLLTHALRSIHDGILIGGQTLLIDNPRLTNRLWEGSSPRPIILDTHLRNVKMLGSRALVRNPIICCSIEAANSIDQIPVGMSFLPCRCSDDGRLDLHDVLKKLRALYGIRSVMVEGGAAVLSSFFQNSLVDFVCITIAPKFLQRGKSVLFSATSQSEHIDLSPWGAYCIELGQDAIFVSRWEVTK